MDTDKLISIVFKSLKEKLEESNGLGIFAKERSKFEGWLKVELCDTLSKHSKDIFPEKGRVDIVFDNWLIELKTVNTNYRYKNVENKHRPITKNVSNVIEDILALKKHTNKKKAVIFVTFPVEHNNPDWQKHLLRMKKHLSTLEHVEFKFVGGFPGVLYFGLV